ncbi:MAG TPA: 3-phosphoshikimate 1-carboxyvinyltransferase [Chitinophagaceae bacterium]|nr:3-phosphoshikimate 1-carboxyvinyltransferase [Chitinophagaceae bacterium]
MIVTIHPSQLKGIIQAPASKSSMQRALAAALLSKGTSSIYNPGHSNDDKATLKVIEALGAKIKIEKDKLIIESDGVRPVTDEVNCGESALGIRMLTPIIALSKKEITIYGEGSLLSRPMDFFDEILPELAVKLKTNNGKLPIVIQGPLQPANIEIDGSLSSQFITGLIMAYGAHLNHPQEWILNSDSSTISIKVRNLKSKPYIDLTLDVMKQFGLKVPENRNYEEFIFHKDSLQIPPPAGGSERAYTVESDWSGGAFLLVAGAIAGPITVRGLDLTSTQADKAIVDALMKANAGIAIEAKGIKVHPAPMSAFEFDATDCPDLFPPLVALAAYCDGQSTIKGVNRLTYKESNRAVTLQQEFAKMEVRIELNDDMMSIHGGNGVKNAKFESHHDHRIAMACTIAALKSNYASFLYNPEAVKKSYPDFYADLKSLGASVEIHESSFSDAFSDWP